MTRTAHPKLIQLTKAATTLALDNGLEATTISAIAAHAGLPQGSVYYYFKTKDDVAQAVVAALTEHAQAATREWDAAGDPRARLVAFIDHQELESARVALTAGVMLEVRRAGRITPTATPAEALLDWATAQYQELGFPTAAAGARAMHLIAGMEGAAVLAASLGVSTPVEREAAHLRKWVAGTAGTTPQSI